MNAATASPASTRAVPEAAADALAADGPSSAPVGMSRSVPYIPELESLRGIAMVLVYSFHVDRFVAGNSPTVVSPAYAFVRAGHTGVSLFFVLSGFLLSLPFIAAAATGGPVRAGRFWERRALRILPLYYTAVAVATVLSAHHVSDLLAGLPYLAFLNAVAGWARPLVPYSSVWWSLATEAQFYLVLPLLPLCFRSRVGRRAALALLALYAVAYAGFLLGSVHMRTMAGQFMFRLSLFGQAPMFLFGIAVAAVYHRVGTPIRDRLARHAVLRRGGADLALLGTVGALALLLQWQVRVTHVVSETRAYFGWHVLEGLCWASILAVVLLAPLRTRRLLRSRALQHLGVLSYSMYIWHVPFVLLSCHAIRRAGIKGGSGWTPTNCAIFGVLTLLCLALSELTYRGIERPFLVRKARLT